MSQLINTNNIAKHSEARVASPHIGISMARYTYPEIDIMPDEASLQGMRTAPNLIESMSPRQYMNSGLMPNASKKRHQRLWPRMSIIHMSSPRKLDARPHVVSTNVGDHIFLFIGIP